MIFWISELFSKGKIRGRCPRCCAPGARCRLMVHNPFIKYQPFNRGWTTEIIMTKGYVRDWIRSVENKIIDRDFMRLGLNLGHRWWIGRLGLNKAKGYSFVLIWTIDRSMNGWLPFTGQNDGWRTLDVMAPLPLPGESSILLYDGWNSSMFLPMNSWWGGELTRGGFRAREAVVWAGDGGAFFQSAALSEGNPRWVFGGV
jgi:hypothetical protein